MSTLTELIGQELGPTEWFEVDQARIDEFARATDDPQWTLCARRRGRSGRRSRTAI
jgi:acyl dehydratase